MAWHNLLLPLTPFYAAVVRVRAAAFAGGWLKAHRPPVPVISVGNITFGGTGKTPTVIALARELVGVGRRPAVLTRGHGRRGHAPLVVLGPDPEQSVVETGDEPREMARRLPGVPIVVDADRVRGGREAVRRGADVLILDDGFQHLRIARDLDLVLLDAGDPWGGDRLPPRGRLREPVSALTRASAVLITKVTRRSDEGVAAITDRVRRTAGGLPVLTAELRPTRVRTPDGWQPIEVLAGRRVLAFAGLGRPGGFAELLQDAGAEIVGTCWFADHHRYTADELRHIESEAARDAAVPVTTGKDAVKLPGETRVWEVETEMVPISGSWRSLLSGILESDS
jgi:tetraacyldisaccharide 4'-kinase